MGTPHPTYNNLVACLNTSHVRRYFNDPDVRKALHTSEVVAEWYDLVLTTANLDINQILQTGPDRVEEIKRTRMLTYTSQTHRVTELWRELLDQGLEGVIYHGDADLTCDFMGGLWAVESLGLPRRRPTRTPWSVTAADAAATTPMQTAGFLEDFGPIQYVTVKGAGHMVPSARPREAQELLLRFVLNQHSA